MARQMKDSGVEWIGEIPEDWDVLPLGNCFDERNEKVSDYDWEPLSVTKQGIVKQLDTAAKSDAHDARKKVCKKDFVINSRSDRKQSCGVSAYDGSVSLINIVLSSRFLNTEYVKYLLKNYGFAEEFYRWGTGIVADLWSTKYERMKKILLPIPSEDEQQKISDFLDEKVGEIDSVITKTKETIEDYKKYKQAIITDAVTKGLNPDVEMKDTENDWIGKIPIHWGIIKAKNVVMITNGVDPKTEGNIPVYGSGAQSFKTCGEYKEGPTVLIGRKGATLHIPHYIDGKYWNVDTAFDVKVKNKKIELKYYYYNAVCFDYKKYISQTTLPSMTQTDYSNMYIPYPNREEQREITEYLDEKCFEIDKLIAKKEELLADLESYKKSLIYEYVTGKKEVE